jgi:hypothetical protein
VYADGVLAHFMEDCDGEVQALLLSKDVHDEADEKWDIEDMGLVEVPQEDEDSNEKDTGILGVKFNFKKLWAFTGPGWLMSIAYLDP